MTPTMRAQRSYTATREWAVEEMPVPEPGPGMSGQEPTLGPTMVFNLLRKQVLGHLGYRNEDIGTLAELVAAGRLDLSRSISDVVALEDVGEGIRRLHERDGNPTRILVRPG